MLKFQFKQGKGEEDHFQYIMKTQLELLLKKKIKEKKLLLPCYSNPRNCYYPKVLSTKKVKVVAKYTSYKRYIRARKF